MHTESGIGYCLHVCMDQHVESSCTFGICVVWGVCIDVCMWVLPATDIQAKPLAVLPGSGMCIEVGVKGRSKVRCTAMHGVCFVDDYIVIAIAKHVLNKALFFLLNFVKLLNTAQCTYVRMWRCKGWIHKYVVYLCLFMATSTPQNCSTWHALLVQMCAIESQITMNQCPTC